MTARDRYDELLRMTIGPWLRERGFRKTRNTFNRAFGDDAQLIEFQASQFASRDDVSFTINLGLIYGELAPRTTPQQQPRPSMGRASIRQRVGLLIPTQRTTGGRSTERPTLTS